MGRHWHGIRISDTVRESKTKRVIKQRLNQTRTVCSPCATGLHLFDLVDAVQVSAGVHGSVSRVNAASFSNL